MRWGRAGSGAGRYDWVIDLDVQKFFDTVPWDLIIKAVEAVDRLPVGVAVCEAVACCAAAAPRRHPCRAGQGNPARVGGLADPGEPVHALRVRYVDGPDVSRTARSSGTPTMLSCIVVTRRQAEAGAGRDRRADGARWACGFTRTRRGSSTARTASAGATTSTPASPSSGYTFRPRKALAARTGVYFTSFLPAMSPEALKAKSAELRAMRIHRRTDLTLDDLARWLNPIVAGWMKYYGRFYRSAMDPLLQRVSTYLRRWAGKKYRRLRAYKRFQRWWTGTDRSSSPASSPNGSGSACVTDRRVRRAR